MREGGIDIVGEVAICGTLVVCMREVEMADTASWRLV